MLALGQPGLLGGAEIELNGGGLKLSSPTGQASQTYAEVLTIVGDTSIIAGKAEILSQAGATVTVDSDVNAGSHSLTLGTTDSFTLNIGDPLGVTRDVMAGELNVSEGKVNVSGNTTVTNGIDFSGSSLTFGGTAVAGGMNVTTGEVLFGGAATIAGEMNVSGGTVTTSSAGDSAGTLTVASAAVVDATNPLTITDTAHLGSGLSLSVTPGDSFKISGADLSDARVARELTLEGGTVTTSEIGESGGAMPDGLAIHLDASQITGLNDGDPVTQWDDLSDHLRHVSQANAANQPTYKTGIVNDMPVVRFAGDDFLGRTGDVLAEGDDTYTFVAVWYPEDNATRSIMEQAAGGANRRAALLLVGASYGFNGQNNDAHNIMPYTPDEWHLSIMDIDNDRPAGNVHLEHDGTEIWANSGNPSALNVGTDAFYVGRKVTANGEYFLGDMAELLAFDRVLTDEEMNNVGGYLAEKYGLTGMGYTGGLIGSMDNTNITVTASTALELTSEPGVTLTLPNVTVNGGVEFLVDAWDNVVHVNDLTLDGEGAKWLDADVVVNGTLSTGESGMPAMGSDIYNNSITLASTATYEWQLSGGAGHADTHFVDTWGNVVLDDYWTLRIVDNGGTNDGSPIRLFLIDD